MTKLQRFCLFLKIHHGTDSIQGCLKHEFGRKNLLTNLCGETDPTVQQKPQLGEKFHSLVPLKVWNVNPHVIKGKVTVLAAKVTRIRWLKNEESVKTDAFGD